MRRTLRLAKETLTELTTVELAGVVGGSGASCGPNPCQSGPVECPTLPNCIETLRCPTNLC
ncbi:MAG: hypothetical protein QOE45_1181 [Frankiaceae bacterium]|jgi:hypothetical protein|nr:hypothetical protein [Frankiaceae bacterium]